MTLMLSWSTLEEPEEQTTMFKEAQLTKFAYLMIQTIIFQAQLTSLLHHIKVWLMALNMKPIIQQDTWMTTMYHVLSAMFLAELQPSWYQLKAHVRRPGPESTMAT